MIGGATLRLLSSVLFHLLNLNQDGVKSSPSRVDDRQDVDTEPLAKGHTAASYRAARQRKDNEMLLVQEQLRQASKSNWLAGRPMLGLGLGSDLQPSESPVPTALLRNATAGLRPDLLSTTILEEMSSTSSIEASSTLAFP